MSSTLHGVTRQVPLTGEANGFGLDQWAGSGRLHPRRSSRRDFGIDLTIPMDGGGIAVGDKVSISLEIEAVSPSDPTRTGCRTPAASPPEVGSRNVIAEGGG